MSGATYHFPQYRLAKLLRQPGGKAISDALADAQAGLESIKGGCLDSIDGSLASIDALWTSLPTAPDSAGLMTLYAEVNVVIGVASAAGLTEMDRAAYSLCDLLDHMASTGRCDRESIGVHIRALHLLRHPEQLGKGDAVQLVLLGLRRVRDKYAAADARAAD